MIQYAECPVFVFYADIVVMLTALKFEVLQASLIAVNQQ
jgi:hypothetical protein